MFDFLCIKVSFSEIDIPVCELEVSVLLDVEQSPCKKLSILTAILKILKLTKKVETIEGVKIFLILA